MLSVTIKKYIYAFVISIKLTSVHGNIEVNIIGTPKAKVNYNKLIS